MKKHILPVVLALLLLSGCQVADKTTTTAAAPDKTTTAATVPDTAPDVAPTGRAVGQVTMTTFSAPEGREWYYHLEGEEPREDEIIEVDQVTLDQLMGWDELLPYDEPGLAKVDNKLYVFSNFGGYHTIVLLYTLEKYDPEEKAYGTEDVGHWPYYIEYYDTDPVTSGFFRGEPVNVRIAWRNVSSGNEYLYGRIESMLVTLDRYYGYMYEADEAAELWDQARVGFGYTRPDDGKQMYFIPYSGVSEKDKDEFVRDSVRYAGAAFYSALAFRGCETDYYVPWSPYFPVKKKSCNQ